MQIKEPALILNMENQFALPRNFRMTDACLSSSQLSSHGLLELRTSASGQFSQNSLTTILEIIPADKLILIDLREESHGFINGIAVSWYGEKNSGNKDKSLEEIQHDEKERLQKAIKNEYLYIYQKNGELIDPVQIYVKEAYTEAELAQKMGIHYARIPVTDYLKPCDKEVDRFIDFIKTHILNEKNSDCWMHLHCAAGRGRSTTFISMYDMMLNASHLSCLDILARQAMIGGKDLTEPFEISDWRYGHHFERLNFLLEFYNYCLENPNLEQSWTSWKKVK